MLNFWYTNMTPLYLVSDAVDIQNGKYIITNNPSRKQDYREYTVWTLELATYDELYSLKVQPLESLAKYTGKSPKVDTKNTTLATCDLGNFIYTSDSTKSTKCTR